MTGNFNANFKTIEKISFAYIFLNILFTKKLPLHFAKKCKTFCALLILINVFSPQIVPCFSKKPCVLQIQILERLIFANLQFSGTNIAHFFHDEPD